jgi:hypothetical protein
MIRYDIPADSRKKIAQLMKDSHEAAIAAHTANTLLADGKVASSLAEACTLRMMEASAEVVTYFQEMLNSAYARGREDAPQRSALDLIR